MGGLFSNDDNKIYPDNESYGESSQIASTHPNISRRKPAINKSRPKRRSSPKKKENLVKERIDIKY